MTRLAMYAENDGPTSTEVVTHYAPLVKRMGVGLELTGQ